MSEKLSLEEINDFLRERKLKLFDPNYFGRNKDGIDEIVGIADCYERASKHFTIVTYRLRRPDGSYYEYSMDYTANSLHSDGSIVLVRINDLYAIVKQWRVPLQRKTYEFARASADKKLTGDHDDQQWVFACLAHELGQFVVDAARVTACHHLDTVATNTGVSAMRPDLWVIGMSVPEDVITARVARELNGITLYLWGEEKVERELMRKLRDSLSLSLLMANDVFVARSV